MADRIAPVSARVRLVVALLLAALALAAIPALAHGAGYVAMGDSYSSGVGTREYYSSSGSCQRSPHAYPVKAAARIGLPLNFVACSGAKTDQVLASQVGALNSGTSRVTISVGGNDAGFSNVITSCARPWPYTCWGDIDNAQNYIRNTLPGRLDAVYAQIDSRAPSAVVAVVGYPRVFNGRDTCNAGSRISAGEQTRLNDTANLLASTTGARATAWGFSYVDPIPAFVGHAVCDSSAWINGLSSPVSESYHPNRAGQDTYTNLVVPAID